MKREQDFTKWFENKEEKKNEYLTIIKAQQDAKKDLKQKQKKWQFYK